MRTVRAVHVVTSLLGLRADRALELSKETSTFVKTKKHSLDNDEDPSQITFREYAEEFLLRRGAHYFNSDEDSTWYYPDDSDEIVPLIEEIMYRQWTYRRENSTRSTASTKRSRDIGQEIASSKRRSKVVKLSSNRERTSKRRPYAKPEVSSDTSSEGQTPQPSQVEEIVCSQYPQTSTDSRQATSSSGFMTVNEISNTRPSSVGIRDLSLSPEELRKHSQSWSTKPIEDLELIPAFQILKAQRQTLSNTTTLPAAASQTTQEDASVQASSTGSDHSRIVKYADSITQTVGTYSQESRATKTNSADDDRQPIEYSDGSTQTSETYSVESRETQTMTTNEEIQSLKSTYMLADGKVVQICESEGNQIFKLIIERLKAQVNDYLDKIECGYDAPSELDCYRHTVSQLSHTLRLADLKIRKAEKPAR